MTEFRAAFPLKKEEKKSVPVKKTQENKLPSEDELICDGCGKEIPAGKAKYVPRDDSTVLALCPVCSGRAPAPKHVEVKIKSKKVYKCTRCDYEFKFDSKGTAVLKCPYCGRNDRLKEHIPAEEIIKGIKPDEDLDNV